MEAKSQPNKTEWERSKADLRTLSTVGIFLISFLSLLGVVFNILLSPVKKDMARLDLKTNRIESQLSAFQSEVKKDFEKVEARIASIENKLDKALSK